MAGCKKNIKYLYFTALPPSPHCIVGVQIPGGIAGAGHFQVVGVVRHIALCRCVSGYRCGWAVRLVLGKERFLLANFIIFGIT